jgi:hypothetical protein
MRHDVRCNADDVAVWAVARVQARPGRTHREHDVLHDDARADHADVPLSVDVPAARTCAAGKCRRGSIVSLADGAAGLLQ